MPRSATPSSVHGSTGRRSGRGFTIIEILVVVVIIGIIAIFVIPNFLDSLNKAKQKRTMADMHDVGKAMMSWLTGEVGAAAAGAGAGTLTLAEYGESLEVDDLRALLIPDFIPHVPDRDAWGHAYDYHLKIDDLLSGRVMLIRSPGADGVFAGSTYTFEPFIATAYREDIVWADGLFVRWPVGLDAYGAQP